MLGEQAHLPEPAAPRDGGVFLAGLVIEVGDEHFGDLRGDGDAERDGRKKCRPEAVRLDHAKDAELETEEMDQHQADDEVGHRQEQ